MPAILSVCTIIGREIPVTTTITVMPINQSKIVKIASIAAGFW
jgi:hypothetical protein